MFVNGHVADTDNIDSMSPQIGFLIGWGESNEEVQRSTNSLISPQPGDALTPSLTDNGSGLLESELKCPAPASSSCDCASIIRKKDRQIEKMELEIRILYEQRDLAQSEVKELSQMIFLSSVTGNQDDNLESCFENLSPRVLEHEEECTSEMGVSDDQCSDIRCCEIKKSEADRRFTEAADDVRSQITKKLEEFTNFQLFFADLKDAKIQCRKPLLYDPVHIVGGKIVRDWGLNAMHKGVWDHHRSKLYKDVVELWNTCNVSEVHRISLIDRLNGKPSDTIYLEAELRKLIFLKDAISQGNHDDRRSDSGFLKFLLQGNHDDRREKTLWKERKTLSKQINKRFITIER